MKIFLVGGAIRDELLGIPFNEKDWVVVNSSHKEMIKQGFKQVGKNFPVYLHPKTKEEYALARKERKTGKGHKNFSFNTKSNISLKEDLDFEETESFDLLVFTFLGEKSITNQLICN